MKRAVVFAAVLSVVVGVAPAGADVPAHARPNVHLQARTFQPVSRVSTTEAMKQSVADKTVRMWKSQVTDGVNHYTISMVGRNPGLPGSRGTSIRTYLVNVTVVNNGTDVFSPSAPDPCDPAGVSPETRVLNSPIFKKHAYTFGGTAINPTPDQYLDAFQRSEFWSDTNPSGISPQYHVTFTNPVHPGGQTQVLNVEVDTTGATEVSTACGKVLEIPIADWDAYMQADDGMFSQGPVLVNVGPTDLPVFLLHNVVFNNGSETSCCILGYHNAFSYPAQTYVVADYDTSGGFPSAPDIAPLSSALAGWMDNPLATNATNPWGHIGQVTGCESKLEPGDPLFGKTIPVKMNHFTYHPQELAFVSWFYHQTPSAAVNGWYSDNNTFITPPAPCS